MFLIPVIGATENYFNSQLLLKILQISMASPGSFLACKMYRYKTQWCYTLAVLFYTSKC